MMRRAFLACAFLAILPTERLVAAEPGVGETGPSPDAVLHKLADRYSGVSDFTVRMTVVADIKELNVPTMTLTMFWKRPDKIHIESEGLAIIPREAAGFAPDQLLSRYLAEAMANDTLDGRAVIRLTLVPKSDQARPRRLLVYIDPDRWTAERITSTGPGDRSIATQFEYTRVDSFWMPSVVTVTFSSQAPAVPEQGEPDQQPPMGRRTPPRNGKVTITYSDYHINSGIEDSLFAPESP